MRLLNRTAGRLSRHRRSRSPAWWCCCSACCSPVVLYSLSRPPRPSRPVSADEQVAQGRELFLVGCSFCHGQNGEGVRTTDGDQLGPSLVGVGAAAVDFQVGTGRMPMAQPGPAGPRKAASTTTTRSRPWRRSSPRSAPARPSPTPRDYSLDGLSEQRARGGGRPRRPDLPHQLHRLPQLRRRRRRDAAGRLRALAAPASSDKHIYEAMLTGPQQMPSFSNGSLSPDEKRDVIAYIMSLQRDPGVRRLRLGALGPVAEGLFAWLVGIGAARRRRDLDRRAHRAYVRARRDEA